MKKILLTVLVLVLWLVYSGMALPSPDECFTYSCSPHYANPRTHVHGDWEVIYESKTTCKIYDLSEQGKELEVVVIPTEIAGRKVVGFHTYTSKTHNFCHHITSENMKKVYFTNYIPCDDTLFGDREGLWVFILFAEEKEDPIFSQYNTGLLSFPPPLIVKNTITDYYEGQNIDWYEDILLPASVSYYYNYDNAPNQGYYWLDDGYINETIKHRPKDPTREGYEFTGWYKEPECVNEWDFDTDIVFWVNNEKDSRVFYETALYAGWTEI
ncbi:MAG: InlB B-repeat-containing protein [Clostridia bacterium]|nr:InlB B-repeat-containing protein [Clostridia bacterium]